MDTRFALIHGALCVVAVVFAAHVPENRRGAIALSVLMLAGWAVYAAAWTPANPGFTLQSAGVPLTNKDLWALHDALMALVAVALGWSCWWGWAFWAAALAATAAHLSYSLIGTDFAAYAGLLDNILRAQIALFFLIGGRGVGNRVLHFCRRLRDVRRPGSTAFQRARP